MKSCKQSNKSILYLKGELSAAEAREFAAHLSECSTCSYHLSRQKKMDELFSKAPSPALPENCDISTLKKVHELMSLPSPRQGYGWLLHGPKPVLRFVVVTMTLLLVSSSMTVFFMNVPDVKQKSVLLSFYGDTFADPRLDDRFLLMESRQGRELAEAKEVLEQFQQSACIDRMKPDGNYHYLSYNNGQSAKQSMVLHFADFRK